MSKGVISRGVSAPMIKEGDDIVKIVVDSVINEVKKTTIIPEPYYVDGIRTFKEKEKVTYNLNNKDVIGITESVIARATGQYVTVDDIATDIIKKYGENATIALLDPIYSRNRFSMILKGISRAAKEIIIYMPSYDEVGNPSGVNPFTGVNIEEYYKEICKNENCECSINVDLEDKVLPILNCRLHTEHIEKPKDVPYYYLDEICDEVSPDWGLLGTNKSTEERLKLFPSKEVSQGVCEKVKSQIKKITGKDVIVCVYGDGCLKDPVGGIWEFADPITMPGYTDKELIESTPNEIKLKAFIDEGTSEEEIKKLIQQKKDLVGSMTSQGTTPRLYRDLLASLMDLTSGSGDRATPIILIQNYFRD